MSDVLFEKVLPVAEVGDEARVWATLVRSRINLPPHLLSICQYGVTETVNNILDHSSANTLRVAVKNEGVDVSIEVEDDGVGIFARLRGHFGFESDVHALVELIKGKLTVAPAAHSGEGLFFACRMFDRFTIDSGELSVLFGEGGCSASTVPMRSGTKVTMTLSSNSTRTAESVFAEFCDPARFSFRKTRFQVAIAAFDGALVSRSQAKRVAFRLEAFDEVALDFAGVESVGQAFADELFRVWPLAHQETRLVVERVGPKVEAMISHVRSRGDLPQPSSTIHPGGVE